MIFFGEGGRAGDMRGMGEGYRLDLSRYCLLLRNIVPFLMYIFASFEDQKV